MLTTTRKPATVGEILTKEFLRPLGLTQAALADAMGVARKHVNELCNDRRTVTAATALILARVFGNSPEFWLNTQRRTDIWAVLNSPEERARVDRAKPLAEAAWAERHFSEGRGKDRHAAAARPGHRTDRAPQTACRRCRWTGDDTERLPSRASG